MEEPEAGHIRVRKGRWAQCRYPLALLGLLGPPAPWFPPLAPDSNSFLSPTSPPEKARHQPGQRYTLEMGAAASFCPQVPPVQSPRVLASPVAAQRGQVSTLSTGES